MKLFLIERAHPCEYDSYDSFVVAAHGLEDAKHVPENWGDWVPNLREISSKEIGEAKEGTERGIILGSFHAG